MAIKDRIQKIHTFFKEMQVSTEDGESVIYVVVDFPHNWVIDDDIEKKFDVQIAPGNTENEYYFFTTIEKGEDRIFDAIEYNVERMKEAIERANLLSKKTLELKTLFEDESISIEQLRNLKIICPTGQQSNMEIQESELPQIVFSKAKKKNAQEFNPNPQQKVPSPSSEKTDEVFEAKDSDSAETSEKED